MFSFKQRVILACLLVVQLPLWAQLSVRDSAISIPAIRATFGFQVPGGDLADQFGPSFTIGADILVKTNKNLLLGAEGNFLFGGSVKNQEDILGGLLTSEGWIIDQYGSPGELFLYERGYSVMVKLGKVFAVVGPNPNSGLFVTVGGGYLWHKVRIENIEGTVPQVMGDYKKGYDRLSGGPALAECIGYMHYSNNRRINFFAGLEFQQAWTSSLRPYDFNRMDKDDSRYLDLLFGLKLGWMFTLYKKSSDSYYFY